MESTSLETKLWITGEPHSYILCYRTASKRVVPVELQSFRPDPATYLRKNKKYRATLVFESDTHSLEFLRRVIVFHKNTTYTFYRF